MSIVSNDSTYMNIQSVPKSWKDVTVDMYMQLIAIPSYIDEKEKTLRTIQVLTGYSRNSIINSKAHFLRDLTESLNFLKNPPSSEVSQFFTLHDKEFAIIPDLNHLTVGEMCYCSTS